MIDIGELLRAYREGYFPMNDPSDGQLYWCCPHERAVVPLASYRPSRDVRRLIRRNEYQIRFDTNFEGVIRACAGPRRGESETWISEEIVSTYIKLHRLGIAHSVESWYGGELVGGLYGLAVGGAFFGESMFYRRSYASQVAFDRLVEHLCKKSYLLLDAQIMNPHLMKLGAVNISHESYMYQLDKALHKKIRFL
ncbi:MAG: leucyl/phenylalanyl-tRNA--protein transferase [Chlorobium sp.]|jgi:leucyl/phenylalanyl-tRNA--protein transferase|uniref:leucyl/phenylalanyl-tRNA--protein transferase n=1 Tax=Chlorobium sp. TaxID=1095 RepID=UPI001E02DC9A|nr:leucyl/phenylalanyl-tRNA--protein transferase [Chlorobium sp.]MBN1278819.1 leucyl/phenylalanyl-tRNA--protein transferase [Chlorobiaceae bacterium]MCF8215318.1 leucyl/phenylalanyl-tRNA--protein transferase [Chlorobium sp.]MCF8270155.1 leucyl/phenylalanyl-tRNA--protein transferase [Chlorobium sp.]MCF8286525.1 leucyl/phenylalanyl-tRNA--protein transferase [Chlorobium sp.]MCF8290123.1 leucyl/phenylalanyl-tRNA--protein transferase [Chlorobium sp.]